MLVRKSFFAATKKAAHGLSLTALQRMRAPQPRPAAHRAPVGSINPNSHSPNVVLEQLHTSKSVWVAPSEVTSSITTTLDMPPDAMPLEKQGPYSAPGAKITRQLVQALLDVARIAKRCIRLKQACHAMGVF